MNKEQLKKSVGDRVRIVPVAIRLDSDGFELPQEDDVWIIDRATDEGLEISNIRTGHRPTLAFDHIYRYTSDPGNSQGGIKHGFLTLHVQLYLQGAHVHLKPNTRPGERVAPPRLDIKEKFVDIGYPRDVGLVETLAAEGYSVRWCSEPRVSRAVEIDGWEVVIARDANGVLCTLHLKDRPANQVLIKKRTA